MVKASQETGKFLMIGHNQRLAKAHAEARKLIQDGLIGDIITFKTNFAHGGPETWSIDPGQNVWFFDKKKAVMGAMADLGIHKTDLVQFLTGSKAVSYTHLTDLIEIRFHVFLIICLIDHFCFNKVALFQCLSFHYFNA